MFLANLKGSLCGVRQFLTAKNPLKLTKNAFHFMLKALFVFEIFTFLIFVLKKKWFDEYARVNFKIYDVAY